MVVKFCGAQLVDCVEARWSWAVREISFDGNYGIFDPVKVKLHLVTVTTLITRHSSVDDATVVSNIAKKSDQIYL